jgi:capsular polysaccharide biosynthesis protein
MAVTSDKVRIAGGSAIRLVNFPDSYGWDDWETREPLEVQTYADAVAGPVKHLRIDGRAAISGAIYDAGGQLIRVSERQSHLGRATINSQTLPVPQPRAVLKGSYIYAGLAIPPFGHVLIEFLSRLWWINSLADLSDRRLLLHPYLGVMGTPLELPSALRSLLNLVRPDAPTRYLRTPWVRAFTSMLGLRAGQVSIVPNKGARIEQVQVASPAISVNGAAHRAFPRIYRLLADRICGDMRADGRRVYLSRSRLRWDKRRAVNETELEALLAQHGFEIVYPEQIPLADQVRLMRQADVVAGCGGSAMHMVCFARPGTRALVLDARAVNNQFAIEQVCGIRATHLWMGSKTPFRGLSEWTIDLDMVRRHLPAVTEPVV